MIKSVRGRLPLLTVTVAGALALLITIIISVYIGSTSISVSDVVRSLLSFCRLISRDSVEPAVYMAVTSIRLPRVLCGVLAGGGLAVSGAVMQGVFRNPMADPGLLGVSSGAGFGALIAFKTGMASFFMLPALSFAGALAAVVAILGVSFAARGGRTSSITLVMSGMAVSALFSALTSVLLSLSNEYQVNNYIFWTMGGLTNRRWEHVATMIIPILACTILLMLFSGRLDIMMLGDEQAEALGINSSRNRVIMILLASLCTASIVCVTGPIGFVGLMVPHIMRLIVGPSHRTLCIASLFAGGVFLTLCDSLIRWISGFNSREFSVGIITAMLGAPFFLFLLIKRSDSVLE
jgi:iron complex transport system permease protein